MSLRPTPWVQVYNVIGENMKHEHELPADEFIEKYQAWLDAFKSILKPQDLLKYRESIRGQEWWKS